MLDPDFQRRLLATYQVEARELLAGIAAGLVALERAPAANQAPLTETVFRQAHSLKGAARSVSAADVESVCQLLESVFARLKSGEGAYTPELLDRLHQTVHLLEQLVAAAPEDAAGASPLADEARQLLAPLLPGAQASPEAPPPPSPAPQAPRPAAGAEDKLTLPETVRIATDKLDRALYQAEEMVSAKLAASQRAADLERLHGGLALWRKRWGKLVATRETRPAAWADSVQEFLEWNQRFLADVERDLAKAAKSAEHDQAALGGMVDTLLEETKDILMLPFASLCEPLPAMARNLARQQGKEVDLLLHGGDIQIDRRLLQEMKDPLIHLVRNSIDHGLEPPEQRQRRGKSPRGLIRLSIAQRSGNAVEIRVADDGAGIDLAQVKAAALNSGRRSAAQLDASSEEQLLALLFESGFTTAPSLTDVSGRGLGLAIVRERVEKLGGSVAVESRSGAGATFVLALPSTLARFRGVVVSAAGQRFILPTVAIQSVARVCAQDIQAVERRETVRLAGQTLALARLAQVLELAPPPAPAAPPPHFPVLVLRAGPTVMAFLVDEVLTEQEVLMKSLGRQLPRVRHFTGAAVLGEGRVVPILNTHDLVQSALRQAGRPPGAGAGRPADKPKIKTILVAEDSITSRALLKNILQGAGYRVETAVDGADAWARLKAQAFDLVLSDLEMPRVDGFELTARVRQDPQLARLPVVLVTALASREHRERGLAAGANAYVVKSSFDQSNLLEIIGRLLWTPRL